MKIEIPSGTVEVELTTESAASSFGLPVLRVAGVDHGPCDWVGSTGLMAGDIAILGKIPGTRGFLNQAPDAARWWDVENVIE